jgi:hypothetical protein
MITQTLGDNLMPTVQTKSICDNAIIPSFGIPTAITAATWGPTNGYYVVTPFSVGTGAAIRVERLSLITSATLLTSCKCKVSLDAVGDVTLAVWTGTVTLKAVGAYTVTFEPKTLFVMDHYPADMLASLSANIGSLYFQFYTDVNTTISGFLCDYTIEDVRPRTV